MYSTTIWLIPNCRSWTRRGSRLRFWCRCSGRCAAELGKEKADAIVKEALRGWSKELFAAIGDNVDGSPRRKWAAMHSAMAEATEQDVTVKMRRHDKEALEFDITHCRFAEFFRALGEPELGALLICETDFDIAAAGEREVSFTRDQTIMQGAPSCTFRYKFAPR